MEITICRDLDPYRIFLDAAERVIHTLLALFVESFPIGWKNTSQIDNIIVFRNIIHSRLPHLLPAGAELHIIFKNQIVLNIRMLVGKFPPKAKMAECASGYRLLPMKIVRIEKALDGRRQRKGAAINIVTDDEMRYLKEIESYYTTDIPAMPEDLSKIGI